MFQNHYFILWSARTVALAMTGFLSVLSWLNGFELTLGCMWILAGGMTKRGTVLESVIPK